MRRAIYVRICFWIAIGLNPIPALAQQEERPELAAKRKLNGQLTWWSGSFYGGKLDELEAAINWNPAQILTFNFVGTHNIGRLPGGDFEQTLIGTRIRFNASPDLQLSSFIQFDTDSKTLGINARIHWIFHPQGDLFFVFNNNTFDGIERWEPLNQQLLLKVRYSFRREQTFVH